MRKRGLPDTGIRCAVQFGLRPSPRFHPETGV